MLFIGAVIELHADRCCMLTWMPSPRRQTTPAAKRAVSLPYGMHDARARCRCQNYNAELPRS